MAPYILFDHSVYQLEMLATDFDGLAQFSWQKQYVDAGGPLNSKERVEIAGSSIRKSWMLL